MITFYISISANANSSNSNGFLTQPSRSCLMVRVGEHEEIEASNIMRNRGDMCSE